MTDSTDNTATITIVIDAPTAGCHAPVRLDINGSRVEIPVNQPAQVTQDHLNALGDTDHSFTILEGAQADEAEQAPAPAGSGDGGDAGGGGAPGEDPAADTDQGDGEEVALPEHFLDRSVPLIVADLPGLNRAQLEHARADEETGKTRSSLIAAIDAALAAPEPSPTA